MGDNYDLIHSDRYFRQRNISVGAFMVLYHTGFSMVPMLAQIPSGYSILKIIIIIVLYVKS